MDTKQAIHSVAIDRLVMLATLVALVPLGATFYTSDNLRNLQIWGAILLFGAVTVTALIMLGDQIPSGLRKWAIARWVGDLASDMRRVLLDRCVSPAVVLLSAASHLNVIAAWYLIAAAVTEPPPFWSFMALIPPVLFVSTLPISLGGWGTRELSTVLLLGSVGINPSTAVLISAIFGIAGIVIGLPAAFFLLGKKIVLEHPVGEQDSSR